MNYSKTQIWQEVKDYTGILIGLTMYAVGFTCFMLPYQITTGGLAGIAAIKELGFRFCVKTIVGIVVLTFLLGLFQEFIVDENGNMMRILGDQTFMSCVLGASCEGIGLAIVFLNNGSTGGTDIIAAIVNKYKDITLGRILMICDIIIVSSCYFVFHDLTMVVFGYSTLIISMFLLDYFMNSIRQSVQFFIFSNKYEQIAETISRELDRGVTVLYGEGWYSKEQRRVLTVLAKRKEGIKIFRIINQIDPNAFVSQSNVVGVYGEGFDRIKVK